MGKKDDKLRTDVVLANKELKGIGEAIELIGGIHLEMSLSFSLGILSKTISNAQEVYDELSKNNFKEYSSVKKDVKTGEDQQYIPIKKVDDFSVKQKELDNIVDTYSVPTLSLADFTAKDEEDEDDPKNKIPVGFVVRILPILTDYLEEGSKKE